MRITLLYTNKYIFYLKQLKFSLFFEHTSYIYFNFRRVSPHITSNRVRRVAARVSRSPPAVRRYVVVARISFSRACPTA